MGQKSFVELFGEQAKLFFSKFSSHIESENLVCKLYMGSKELFEVTNLNYMVTQSEISVFVEVTKEMIADCMIKHINSSRTPYINKIELYDGDIFLVSKSFQHPEYLSEAKDNLTITYNFDFNYPQLLS